METTNQINLFYPVLFILIFGISLLYCFFKFKKIDQETQNKTTTTLKLVHKETLTNEQKNMRHIIDLAKHSLDKPFTVQYTILQEKEMQDIQERLKILEETVKKYIQ
jgi:hypothetical protein